MNILLLILLVISSTVAILVRDMLKSALALAVASIFLAIIFFRMGAVYASVFEISVVAGLITVLFVSTIAMTQGDAEVKEKRWPLVLFPVFLVLVVIFDFVLMKKVEWLTFLGSNNKIPLISQQGMFGQVLWTQRTFDLVGQLGIILAGVVVVLSLFRNRKE